MRFSLLIYFLLNIAICGQTIKLNGKVIDGETKEVLAGVNITINNFGTASELNGNFILEVNVNKSDSIKFTHIGYEEFKIQVSEFEMSDKIIKLKKGFVRLSKSVVVEGLIAKEGETPASFSKINRKQIDENYTVQDVPEYLSYLPSTTFYSENGNGIGYNYISIRGFGQRRISISVNGIPQNDPEDHNVYWLDMPDLLESADLLQVQRGAGAGIIGYPSIGGSINIITSPFSDKSSFELSSSLGSYNTRKYSAKFSSGLIKNKYSVYAKLSKTLSDGYRKNSWIDYNSYHVSAARYDENLTTILNFYGGPISDGLAYYGLPKSFIKDKDLRKTNILSKYEIENFSQPHYEILNEYKLSDEFTINNALFLVTGEGFFDYDGSWAIPEWGYDDYFRLNENGFNLTQNLGNILIHAVVENKQWGIIPRLTWEHGNGSLVSGIEYRNHRSKHWGNIKYAENIPEGVTQDYQYYYYEGAKDILNLFVNENYYLTSKINLMGEMQLSYHKYKLFNEKYLANDISIDGLNVNPRIGFNYKFDESLNSYISYARVTREPRLKNYYDAAESSGGAVPQFEQFDNGSYDFNNPLVQPETMNDIELGARYSHDFINLNANIYYMLFNNEIVSNGQLDRFGQPITGNIDKTIHSGIEIDGNIKLNKNIEFIFNGSYSKNFIQNGSNFINTTNDEGNSIVEELNLSNNKIGGFPEVIMNSIIKFNYNGFVNQLSAKYVGDYYSDNYDKNLNSLLNQFPEFVSYNDNLVDNYFVVNFMSSYEFELNNYFKKVKLFIQVNNVFDKLYAGYATGGDFFPAAERNFLTGLTLGF